MTTSNQEDRVLGVHEALVGAGAIEPLSPAEDDVRAWLDMDLASLVEGHLHSVIDTQTLSAEQRERWVRLATEQGRQVSPHDWSWMRPYWLLEGQERVGTIALDCRWTGLQLLRVSSLFVTPSRRRCGLAGGVLARALEATRAVGGSGLRIETSWTWQDAVRFYLGLGLWVLSWKHSLAFVLSEDLPPYRIEVGDGEATLSVQWDGGWKPVLAAENHHTRLGWTELPAYAALDARLPELRWRAPGTFALHLAVRGWPLVRSDELWEKRHHWSDLGMPEGLAYKIAIFEAVDRQRGYDVRTPRIPGLAYDTDGPG